MSRRILTITCPGCRQPQRIIRGVLVDHHSPNVEHVAIDGVGYDGRLRCLWSGAKLERKA